MCSDNGGRVGRVRRCGRCGPADASAGGRCPRPCRGAVRLLQHAHLLDRAGGGPLDRLLDDLAARAASGDRRATTLLLEVVHHLGLVRPAIVCLLDDPMAADDAIQATLLAVERRISTFQCRSLFRTWLFAVARNEALMALRRRPPVPIDPWDDQIDRRDDGARFTTVVVSQHLIDELAPTASPLPTARRCSPLVSPSNSTTSRSPPASASRSAPSAPASPKPARSSASPSDRHLPSLGRARAQPRVLGSARAPSSGSRQRPRHSGFSPCPTLDSRQRPRPNSGFSAGPVTSFSEISRSVT